MFLKLIAMIVLGMLSAALSYYGKNYYVSIFDDILGKEEDDNDKVRVGRGFIYGFLFPIFFVALLIGAVALAIFLIIAGVVAAIVFVLVWISEKLPHERFGLVIDGLFARIGLAVPPRAAEPARFPATPEPTSARQKAEEGFGTSASAPSSTTAPQTGQISGSTTAKETGEPREAAPSEGGINVTRHHSLD